jgi:hypothetical protein
VLLDYFRQQAQAHKIELAVVAEEKCLAAGKDTGAFLPFPGCLLAGKKIPIILQRGVTMTLGTFAQDADEMIITLNRRLAVRHEPRRLVTI